MSLGRIVGPLWGGIAFDINYLLPYLSGAVVMFLTFFVSLVLLPKEDRQVQSAAVSPSAEIENS